MHSRSMRQTSFELPCNRLLRDMLGKYGAINGFIEMSCQQMSMRVKGMKIDELMAFLKDESAKYDIQLYDFPIILHSYTATDTQQVMKREPIFPPLDLWSLIPKVLRTNC